MHLVSAAGDGPAIGTIELSGGGGGLALHVQVHGLPPGDHGLHIHANGVCSAGPNAGGEVVAAGGAGGHFDPMHVGRHEGPEGMGHMGDLPLLHVDQSGNADVTLLAPHIRDLSALRGHAIVIHAGGDTYSDSPAPLGGGGARIACGVII
jgi:Cu-Zn family superoxide dismutase